MLSTVRFTWRGGLLGALNGLIVGGLAEFIHGVYGDYRDRLTAAEFERLGMSPPLMTDMLHWWSVPFTVAIALIIVALIVHRFFVTRLKSCLLIWEIIAFGGVILAGILWQLISLTGPPNGPFSIGGDIRRLQSGSTVTDLIVSGSVLRSWLVLLILAMVVNLVYAALLRMSGTLYGSNRVSAGAT